MKLLFHANRFVNPGGSVDLYLDFPLPVGELQLLRAKAEQQRSTDFTPFWSGQAAPMGREMPAKALTAKLATEALERFQQLGGLSKSDPDSAHSHLALGLDRSRKHFFQ